MVIVRPVLDTQKERTDVMEGQVNSWLAAARSGDRQAFGALVEPHRPALLVHCYRLLGSLESAEDLVQETLLRAWQHLDRFRGGPFFRAWLYRIATNACLDALATQSRRILAPARYAPADPRKPPAPPNAEPIWLEPFPDALLPRPSTSPEAHYAERESIRLAFLAALQLLPPRQRAILILRDVLDWPAREVAALLDVSESAVTSALHRARTTLRTQAPEARLDGTAERADATTLALLERYVEAWERDDVAALTALLHEEARLSMPPSPSWYRGRSAISTFWRTNVFPTGPGGRWRLRVTRANGQPAFGVYLHDAERGEYHPHALQVLAVADNRIMELTIFFSPALFTRFGLPPAVPDDDPSATGPRHSRH
jgi:RNA polymerase sigma-70 factor (ECF subfamily)